MADDKLVPKGTTDLVEDKPIPLVTVVPRSPIVDLQMRWSELGPRALEAQKGHDEAMVKVEEASARADKAKADASIEVAKEQFGKPAFHETVRFWSGIVAIIAVLLLGYKLDLDVLAQVASVIVTALLFLGPPLVKFLLKK